LSCIPKVIEFLGYNPIPWPDDLMERLAWYKQVNGLTLEHLGAEMGCDPEHLADWLSGRQNPCRRNLEISKSFLAGQAQEPGSFQRSNDALSAEITASSGSK
jgi:transcriptional regulator with XRE-family HTH domain